MEEAKDSVIDDWLAVTSRNNFWSAVSLKIPANLVEQNDCSHFGE